MTHFKQILDSIIMLNIIMFSYIGPQNMMDGMFISIEFTYLVQSDDLKMNTVKNKCTKPNTVQHSRKLPSSKSWRSVDQLFYLQLEDYFRCRLQDFQGSVLKSFRIQGLYYVKYSDRQNNSFLNIIHLYSAGLLWRTEMCMHSNKQLFLANAEFKVLKKMGSPATCAAGLKSLEKIEGED